MVIAHVAFQLGTDWDLKRDNKTSLAERQSNSCSAICCLNRNLLILKKIKKTFLKINFDNKRKKLGQYFSALRKLLLVSFCVVVWVSFNVFWIFCFKSFGDIKICNTKKGVKKKRKAWCYKSISRKPKGVTSILLSIVTPCLLAFMSTRPVTICLCTDSHLKLFIRSVKVTLWNI